MPRPSDRPPTLLGAVEGGGTKFLCAVGRGPDDVLASTRIETTTPAATLGAVVAFLKRHPLAAVGVATFGPLELRPDATGYGRLLGTPKPGWNDADVLGPIRALKVPCAIDTDVNAAAVAEARWGAGKGADPVVYITVGTGIGGGLVVHGRPVRGLMHPEMGHVPVPPIEGDDFAGSCPFHGRCLEGLVSGTALRARLGVDPAGIPDDHPVWDLAARHLAAGIASIVLIVSPERVVIGGGVMERRLLPRVRTTLRDLLGGYVPRPELDGGLDRYLVPPAHRDPGLLGAFALAREALGEPR